MLSEVELLHYLMKTATTAAILHPLYRTTCVSWYTQLRTGGFFGAKFYCLHALAARN